MVYYELIEKVKLEVEGQEILQQELDVVNEHAVKLEELVQELRKEREQEGIPMTIREMMAERAAMQTVMAELRQDLATKTNKVRVTTLLARHVPLPYL